MLKIILRKTAMKLPKKLNKKKPIQTIYFYYLKILLIIVIFIFLLLDEKTYCFKLLALLYTTSYLTTSSEMY